MKKKIHLEKKIKDPKPLFTFPPFIDNGSVTQISTKLTSIEYQRLRHLKCRFNCSGQAVVSLALNHFYNHLAKQELNL